MIPSLRSVPCILTALALTACGSLPISPSVQISPADATTTDTLALQIVGAPENAEDVISYDIAWFVDGTEVPELAGLEEVPADRTGKNQTWRAVVTPVDNKDRAGESADASVTVVNTLPSTSVSIEPTVPLATQDLTATPTGDDADTDDISYRYLWLRNGVKTDQTDAVLPADETQKGETWTVQVWPSDDEGEGEVSEASAGIENSLPVGLSVELTPTEAFETSTFQAAAQGEDADEDELSWTYTWFVNGGAVPDVSDDTLDGTHFDKGDSVTVEATPNDGLASGAPVTSESVQILNSAPTAVRVNLTPDPAFEASTLICEGLGFDDADGDGEGWQYGWQVNGKDLSSTASTLDGAAFDKRDVVSCTVIPFDGSDPGEARRSAELTISNTAPVITKVTLSTSSPKEGDVIRGAVDGASDDDGDDVEMRYNWLVDGKSVATTATLTSAYYGKGQTVQLEVRPFDGTDLGTPIKSALATAVNTPPVATSVVLAPTSPRTNEIVRAAATATDADGDKIRWSYAWYVNGRKIAPVGDRIDGASQFDKNAKIYVVATPNDGDDDGASLTSTTITAVNTAPSITGASLSPNPAREADTIVCKGIGWSDDDKDKESYTYSWTVNSKVVGTANRIDGDDFRKGDKVSCTLTPTDGDDDGTAKTTSTLTIQNTAPSIASVRLSSSSPKEGDTLSTVVSGAVDADGDRITYGYAWFVNSSQVATTSTLNSSRFNKGDKIYVVVTPTDGSNAGKAVPSNTATGANTAPVISSASIAPIPAYTNTSLAARYAASDADGDRLGATYDWYVNGTRQSPTGDLLSSAYFSKGDRVSVQVSVSDGDLSATRASATLTISNSAPARPSAPSVTPVSPLVSDNLMCRASATSDADRDRLTYYYAWYRNGSLYGTYATTALTHSISSSVTAADQTWSCRVRAFDGRAFSLWSSDSAIVRVQGTNTGRVRRTDGTWIDVSYEKCGSGTSCTGAQAKSACTKIGKKVVSHASDGTSSVASLGASLSCQYSTSYFTVNKTMASGDCLVGISNLDWSSCCTRGSWHGDTKKFGARSTVFGIVYSSNSGYVASYSNTVGTRWGCQSEASSATQSGCSTLYVACTK